MKKDKLPSLSQIKNLMNKIARANGIPEQVENTWRHSAVVWRLADRIALLAIKNGYPVDRRLLKLAVYVHDLGRMVTGSAGSKILKDPVYHGYEGYKILKKFGYPKLAEFCRRHLGGSGLPRQVNRRYSFGTSDTLARTLEERILAYSDARTLFIKGRGPSIGSFETAYRRFKVYPYGTGERLRASQRLIKEITKGRVK